MISCRYPYIISAQSQVRLASSDAIAIAPGLRALTPAELEPGYGAEHDADEHAAAAMRLWLSLADSRLTLTLSVRTTLIERASVHTAGSAADGRRGRARSAATPRVLSRRGGCRVSLTIDVRNVTVSVLRCSLIRRGASAFTARAHRITLERWARGAAGQRCCSSARSARSALLSTRRQHRSAPCASAVASCRRRPAATAGRAAGAAGRWARWSTARAAGRHASL